jgi:hypothetical protein
LNKGILINPKKYPFNSILNARFEKYIPKNELIRNEQIGFKAGCRTSGHIFKLKTIIDK